ncbi:hypothetical protein GC163_09520 [bacterium]|nr:hypothetical protein [bacterium]
MKSWMLWGLTAIITVTLTTGSFAADEAKKEKKKGTPGAGNQAFNLPKNVELTEEQKTKLEELKKEHGPKLAEIQKKLDGVLTDEQKQARKDAQAKAKADNVKGKEAQAAVMASLKLTDEQKAKYEAAQAEMKEAAGKVRAKIAEFLTEEQKAKVPGLAPKKAKKKAA